MFISAVDLIVQNWALSWEALSWPRLTSIWRLKTVERRKDITNRRLKRITYLSRPKFMYILRENRHKLRYLRCEIPPLKSMHSRQIGIWVQILRVNWHLQPRTILPYVSWNYLTSRLYSELHNPHKIFRFGARIHVSSRASCVVNTTYSYCHLIWCNLLIKSLVGQLPRGAMQVVQCRELRWMVGVCPTGWHLLMRIAFCACREYHMNYLRALYDHDKNPCQTIVSNMQSQWLLKTLWNLTKKCTFH